MTTTDFSENIAYSHRLIPPGRRVITWLLPVLLCLIFIGGVGYLLYRLEALEDQHAELAATVTDMQSELSDTKIVMSNMGIALKSTAREVSNLGTDLRSTTFVIADMGVELSRTKRLAQNANNYAHSHGLSDSSLKTNVQELNATPEQLLSIHAVRYFWTPEAQNQLGQGPEAEIGFLAQDVEEVFPELVWTDPQGYKHVDYERFSVLLLEAMRAQQTQIDQLTYRQTINKPNR